MGRSDAALFRCWLAASPLVPRRWTDWSTELIDPADGPIGLTEAQHEPFVDAIVAGKHVGGAFVSARLDAGEPAFARLWQERGGAVGDELIVAWLEQLRGGLLAALRSGWPR